MGLDDEMNIVSCFRDFFLSFFLLILRSMICYKYKYKYKYKYSTYLITTGRSSSSKKYFSSLSDVMSSTKILLRLDGFGMQFFLTGSGLFSVVADTTVDVVSPSPPTDDNVSDWKFTAVAEADADADPDPEAILLCIVDVRCSAGAND